MFIRHKWLGEGGLKDKKVEVIVVFSSYAKSIAAQDFLELSSVNHAMKLKLASSI